VTSVVAANPVRSLKVGSVLGCTLGASVFSSAVGSNNSWIIIGLAALFSVGAAAASFLPDAPAGEPPSGAPSPRRQAITGIVAGAVAFALYQCVILGLSIAISAPFAQMNVTLDSNETNAVVMGLLIAGVLAMLPVCALIGAAVYPRGFHIVRPALWALGTLAVFTILGQLSGLVTGSPIAFQRLDPSVWGEAVEQLILILVAFVVCQVIGAVLRDVLTFILPAKG
jgi:hypothetical protein